MPRVIVEYEFDPPASDEDLKRMSSTMTPCIQVRQIRWIRSAFSKDRRRGFCELEAPDAETVRDAYRSARVAFRSVWAADTYE